MVSFGFYGKPSILSFEEYKVLAKYGFNEQGEISEEFQNEFYVLPHIAITFPSNEKKVTNVCRFLDADWVKESPLNSVLDGNLKIDIAVGKGDLVFCFQSKSSLLGLEMYKEKYIAKQLDPFYCRKTCSSRKDLPKIKDRYSAPGAVYLSIRDGTCSLPLFLSELSTWLGIPIRNEYQKLWEILKKQPKHISVETLGMILKDRKETPKYVSQMGTIYPIDFKEGYVRLRRQKQQA